MTDVGPLNNAIPSKHHIIYCKSNVVMIKKRNYQIKDPRG